MGLTDWAIDINVNGGVAVVVEDDAHEKSWYLLFTMRQMRTTYVSKVFLLNDIVYRLE